jgi:hypothetical protein
MKITFELDEDTTWTIEGDHFFQLIWGLNDVFQEEEFLEKSEEIDVVTKDQRYILDKAGI